MSSPANTAIRPPVADNDVVSQEAAAEALSAAARGWPGAALAIGPDARVIAASPLSGLTADMRAPFDLPVAPIASQIVDSASRRWRISAPVAGIRLATADLKEEPDAAHRFTAAVSHEIRTPLNGILGMAALLEESELTPSQRDYASAIRKSGARLLDLLNNVLDFSRMEAGDIPLDAAPFDPADLVQDVAELLAPRAHSAGLDIAAIVHPDLLHPATHSPTPHTHLHRGTRQDHTTMEGAPPEAADAGQRYFTGDAGRLRQILFNLAGNAIKFTQSGAVLIEARPGADGEGLSLIVRDTGAGVPEHARARLFDAFSQVSAADAQRDGGVGLGLAIVARLVASMKGTIELDSTWGQGALFRIDLPLARAPSPPLPKSFMRRPLKVALSLPPASELACIAALAPEGAIIVSEQDSPDLVILDAALPPAQIERLAKRQRTLVVLRPGDRSRIEQFRAMGCAGYLIRPLRAASIVDRVGLTLAGAVQSEPKGEAVKPGEAGAVLIADDNAVNALLARSALTAAGFRVDTAGTGAEALERINENDYAVVFMDIRMPVMDGLEATRRIRALAGPASKTPIVAVTADVNPELEDLARAAGVSQLAAKPIDPPRLRELAFRWAKQQKKS